LHSNNVKSKTMFGMYEGQRVNSSMSLVSNVQEAKIKGTHTLTGEELAKVVKGIPWANLSKDT